MIDTSKGQQQGPYEFSCFGPSEKAPGYFVFLANEHCLCPSWEGCPVSLSEVFTSTSYIGYVRPLSG